LLPVRMGGTGENVRNAGTLRAGGTETQ